ncbi:uncharacterized protein LOC128762652 isoform X2 [Synchiropus splendidus]|uniref:uncharacterized protein LOC128762652 isoform X2 n=1 Tax=Synchiropus splendidus TaxID=270530 RepID=UPI00237E0FAB|nr:uncharacterized protein LOC128762652 isoform X2 [Synchiropus splendidus]
MQNADAAQSCGFSSDIKRRLISAVPQTEQMRLEMVTKTPDVQQLLTWEEVSAEQQKLISCLGQDVQEPQLFKEENGDEVKIKEEEKEAEEW